jgi:hypothetical protein
MIEYNLNFGEKLYIFFCFNYLVLVSVVEAAGAGAASGALKALIIYIDTLHLSAGVS